MDVSDLSGKTALVTGAGSGVGKATALAFARRGVHLVISDVNEQGLAETESQIRALGRTALARRVDVANREAVRAFADAVHAEVEAVDILMNNAGVALLHTTLEDWDWIVEWVVGIELGRAHL